MTTLPIVIKDGHKDELKKLLQIASFKAELVESSLSAHVTEPTTQYQKLKKISAGAKEQKLTKIIETPSEWQREARKEWDCDF